jgi:hypothetical protein
MDLRTGRFHEQTDSIVTVAAVFFRERMNGCGLLGRQMFQHRITSKKTESAPTWLKKVGAVIKYCESPKSDPVSGPNSGLAHARWSGVRSCALYMLCVDFVKKVRIARTRKPTSETKYC